MPTYWSHYQTFETRYTRTQNRSRSFYEEKKTHEINSHLLTLFFGRLKIDFHFLLFDSCLFGFLGFYICVWVCVCDYGVLLALRVSSICLLVGHTNNVHIKIQERKIHDNNNMILIPNTLDISQFCLPQNNESFSFILLWPLYL